MTNRESWPDYAKAIGIILVVYGHVARGLYNAGIDMPIYYYQIIDSVIYSFHMPLFFFLSGLFFYNSFSKKGASKLIFSKVDTILYPYIIWSLLQGSIEIILSKYTNGSLHLNEILSLLWAPRAHFWFLYALFFVFILSSIIYSRLSQSFSVVIFLCALCLFLYPAILPDLYIFSVLSDNFVFFMLGIIFTQYFKSSHFSSPFILLLLCMLFIFGQWFFHDILLYRYTDKGSISFVLTCVSILFIISLSSSLAKLNYKYLAYIGSSSMAIYLMHIIIGSGFRVVLTKVLGVDNYIVHLLLGLLIGVSGPLIALYIINKFNIKFVFSAPLSSCYLNTVKKYTLSYKK